MQMILRITFITVLCVCVVNAVLNKEIKRREAFDSYGPPPRPAPQYGPPQHQPHREYGVPQQIPFREYGPPALKYGPPKVNIVSNSGGGSSGGLYEQIKSHFGVPKPFYGPPHRPAPQYGPPPPPPAPQQQYGPPKPQQQYGPPKPQPQYGPPKPQPQYGPPPKQIYGPPPPQALPLVHRPAFKPEHQPSSSYGPPPSGPIPQKLYGPPKIQNNYGPPSQSNFNREYTIELVSGGNQQSHHHHSGPGPVKQVQIQIDSAGHTHSVSGSQAPFHTACDGWKPIPAPIGSFIENNQIEHHGGHGGNGGHGGHGPPHIQQSFENLGGFGSGYASQFTGGTTIAAELDPRGKGTGNILDDLTDEQLVALALQTDGSNIGTNHLGGVGNFNSLDSETLQVSLGGIDDSYNHPPPDSFAPGSIHAQKFNKPPTDSYGPPPSGNYIPPPPTQTNEVIIQEQHQNVGPGLQPIQPVAYRPPVPEGLLLANLGENSPAPNAVYLPPAVNEIPISGPGNLDIEYGPPPPPPPPHHQQPQALPLQADLPRELFEQQLPQQLPHVGFGQQAKGNILNNYIGSLSPPPPVRPQNQYLPPSLPLHPLPPNPPALPPPPQYLPPPTSYQQFTSSGAASAVNEQFIHAQGLPLQHNQQFNQLHNCGQGPNLIGGGYQVQEQQNQNFNQQFHQQQQYASATSSNAYNAISQSIPIAESHAQFVEPQGPLSSYGPPPSGNGLDHDGYASEKHTTNALPDGTDPRDLPALDGLNVISAQKSHAIEISPHQSLSDTQTRYQLEVSGNQHTKSNNGMNHEEILSQGLLQSILSAIDQPNAQTNPNQQQINYNNLASNHNYGYAYDAQSRSDNSVEEGNVSNNNKLNEKHEPIIAESSNKVVVAAESASEHETEKDAVVNELKPIMVLSEVPAE